MGRIVITRRWVVERKLELTIEAVAWTDAEIALKMWRHDPDSHLVPMRLRNAMDASRNRETDKEAFFIRHHGRYYDRVECKLIVEVRTGISERSMFDEM